jgi:hypothetical protein
MVRFVLYERYRTAESTTMYAVLNNTDEAHPSVASIDAKSVIDIGKYAPVPQPCGKWINHTFHPNFCWKMPGSTTDGQFMLVNSACTTGVTRFIRMELSNRTITKGVDVIIVAGGTWEAIRPWDCAVNNSRAFDQFQDEAIDAFADFSQLENVTAIWRTTGFDARMENESRTAALNKRAMERINNVSSPRLVSVDWANAIRPRSFGPDRIVGDLKPHFGLEPRHVLMQMIIGISHFPFCGTNSADCYVGGTAEEEKQ